METDSNSGNHSVPHQRGTLHRAEIGLSVVGSIDTVAVVGWLFRRCCVVEPGEISDDVVLKPASVWETIGTSRVEDQHVGITESRLHML